MTIFCALSENLLVVSVKNFYLKTLTILLYPVASRKNSLSWTSINFLQPQFACLSKVESLGDILSYFFFDPTFCACWSCWRKYGNGLQHAINMPSTCHQHTEILKNTESTEPRLESLQGL